MRSWRRTVDALGLDAAGRRLGNARGSCRYCSASRVISLSDRSRCLGSQCWGVPRRACCHGSTRHSRLVGGGHGGGVGRLRDLVEAPIEDDRSGISRRLLFLAQPRTCRSPRAFASLSGIRADGLPIDDGSLDDRVDYYNHTRRVTLGSDEEPADVLGGIGLRELSEQQWLRIRQRSRRLILSSSIRPG